MFKFFYILPSKAYMYDLFYLLWEDIKQLYFWRYPIAFFILGKLSKF